MEKCKALLKKIYPHSAEWESLWDQWHQKWQEQLQSLSYSKKQVANNIDQLVMLITYGDSIQNLSVANASSEKTLQEPSLKTLYNFLEEVCEGVIRGVHILPYFPYTSDDGFSVSDYSKVREDLGDWNDIHAISSEYHLMTDLIVNHCSSRHEWFQKFLNDEEPYNKYFITEDPHKDFSQVVRPRPHFVLSEYQVNNAPVHVWTTFSRDQVDLNVANPRVLFELLDILLDYVLVHNSRFIRLDAIAYLWKELGTSCIHHPHTHYVVQLMHAVLDIFAPDTKMITETNVPHKENLSYFGNNDEAHMIYQFPLPPLLLYSMITETSQHLQNWAAALPQPTKETSYFNFCASHDGIGITPTYGILSQSEQDVLINVVKKRGGLISYKATADGDIPYELNVNYLSVVANKDLPDFERAKIFLVSQFILLSMPGIPGIYIHSLLGSESWHHGVKTTGHNRTINREKLSYTDLVETIHTKGSLRQLVLDGYLGLLKARERSDAFCYYAPMQVLSTENGVFAIVRQGETSNTLCIANLSSREVVQKLDNEALPWAEGGVDLTNDDIVFVSHNHVQGKDVFEITLEPFESMWLNFSKDTT